PATRSATSLLPAVNHTTGKVCLARRCCGGARLWGPTMAITDIPILSMLRTRLDWAQARQRVLAENVANSDTPGFRARDLAPLQFDEAPSSNTGPLMPVSLTRTAEGHIQGVGLTQSAYRNANSR